MTQSRSATGRATPRWWFVFVVFGLGSIPVYYLLPRGSLVQASVFLAVSTVLPAAILVGIKLHRPADRTPWILMAVGWTLSGLANPIWYLYPLLAGKALPYPSIADALYLTGYLLHLVGLVLLVRRRGKADRSGFVETLLVTLGLSTVSWVLVVEPTFAASGLTVVQRVLGALAYPMVDVVLLGVAARLLLVQGSRPVAFWLLAGSIVAQTAADTEYAVGVLDGSFAFGSPPFAAWLIQYVLLGAAALHPSMRELSEKAVGPPTELSPGRLLFLAIACLVPPVLGTAIDLRAGAVDGAVVAAVSGIIFVLALARLRMLAVNVSELRRIESELRASRKEYRDLVERVPAVSYVAEPGAAGRWSFVSPQIERLLGFSPEEWLADPGLWVKHIHPDDRDGVIEAEEGLSTAEAESTEEFPMLSTEYRMRTRAGAEVWVRDEAFVVPDENGGSSTLRGILTDITERKRLEEKLQHNLLFDPLTDLANRALFTDRMRQALARGARRVASVAVLMVDLDGFKAVNDSLGHAAGDSLLAAIGRRLQECTRSGDTVARLGGDEFAILIEDATAQDGVVMAERFTGLLRAPLHLESKELFIDASIGIAEGRSPDTVDEVLRNADAAMYAAKRAGRGVYEVYRSEHHADVLRRMTLAAELRGAIERSELVLHYQPVVTLPAGDMVGVEALVRWVHPDRGLVPPVEFIPFAEETGLILDIDRWVLAEACRQAREWRDRFPGGEPLLMHVNISARHFREPGFVEHVMARIRKEGLEPGTLRLEITESDLVQDTDAVLAGLHRLREAGIGLAIDDFGVGFSSLNYLRRLPVDVVKIDRAFVTGVATDAIEWSLARGIIRLVHSLGLETVAEGIETAQQVAHLRALECRQGQGFYFARPAPPQAITERLERDAAARIA